MNANRSGCYLISKGHLIKTILQWPRVWTQAYFIGFSDLQMSNVQTWPDCGYFLPFFTSQPQMTRQMATNQKGSMILSIIVWNCSLETKLVFDRVPLVNKIDQGQKYPKMKDFFFFFFFFFLKIDPKMNYQEHISNWVW